MSELHLARWPPFQRLDSAEVKTKLFYDLVDVRRLPRRFKVDGKTIFNLELPVIPVAAALSPLALAPFVAVEAAEVLCALSPNLAIAENKELVFEEPDGRIRTFRRLEFGWNDPASIDVLDAAASKPALPTREPGEAVGDYRNRLLSERDPGRQYALNPDAVAECGLFEFGPVGGTMFATDAFRQAWLDAAISTELERRTEGNIEFRPIEEHISWFRIGHRTRDGLTYPRRNGPRLWNISLFGPDQPEIDAEEMIEPTRHAGPVNSALLTPALNELLMQSGPTGLPSGTVIPLTRPLRHVEYEYAVISTELFTTLQSIAGKTVASRDQILLAGTDGVARSYEYVTFGRQRMVRVDSSACVAPLPADLESAQSELHRRRMSGRRTSVAVTRDVALSTDTLFVEHLGGPIVTDSFIAALAATTVGRQMRNTPNDGLNFRELASSTGLMTWHWQD